MLLLLFSKILNWIIYIKYYSLKILFKLILHLIYLFIIVYYYFYYMLNFWILYIDEGSDVDLDGGGGACEGCNILFEFEL